MSGGINGVNQLLFEVPRQKKESLLLEPPHMILKALALSFKSHLQYMKEFLVN